MKNEKIRLRKNKTSETPYTVTKAVTKGDLFTRFSILFMGLGNIVRRQFVKGLLFLILEICYLGFMINSGFHNIYMLLSLGDRVQEEVWNEAKGIYEYTVGDNSQLILLYGIVALFITFFFVLLWREAVKSAYKAEVMLKAGKHVNTFKDDIKDLFNQNLHKLLLASPLTGILIFTILPLVYMITMAFTDYSRVNDHLVLFNWVGLDNFIQIFSMESSNGKTFRSVLGWTLIWAFFATFSNYILGMLLAIVINRKATRAKSFWRFCFMLSIAVPQFVSLLIMRTMLQQEGAVNVLLKNAGLISESLPFLTDATWARITIIIINIWVGVPFTMIQVTGILQNIPSELYEAARIDGASPFILFFKITLPYMLFVTTPYLITAFTSNVNNFNVIFLLSGGNPTPVGLTAGKTDLLVTWLYKLTVDKQYYNLGSVIGIMTFIILAIFSLLTYRNTKSYKDEEEFS